MEKAVPTLVVLLVMLLMVGARLTVRTKVWVTVCWLFLALMVSVYTPLADPVGVPAIVAVPSPLSVKVTPGGKPPVLVRVGVGLPVAVTVKLYADPWMYASKIKPGSLNVGFRDAAVKYHLSNPFSIEFQAGNNCA
jgi:hypothetical protein